MRFRAILQDPGQQMERPLQNLSDNRAVIDAWAAKVLQSAVAENAAVHIFEYVERPVAIVQRPKPEAKEKGAAA